MGTGVAGQGTSLQWGNAAASSLPALLLLYDITSKMSFDNIRVSPLHGLGAHFLTGFGVLSALHDLQGVWGSLKPVLHVSNSCFGPDPASLELIRGVPGWMLHGWVSFL